jgi:L-histidine N-alpha-methyltransferase
MTSPVRHGHGPATRGARWEQFAIDVQYYLTQHPRQLPSHYFYDALGSALFDAICRLPWYPLTRAEVRLLEAHAREILDGGISTLVELGPGSGNKLSALLAAVGSGRESLDVHLVDVSPTALAEAARAIAVADVRVLTHEATYESGLEEFAATRPAPGPALLLFLGSNIGNFDPPGREAFLRTIRTALRRGDLLLLGADLIRPERELLLAYDDPLGVTAAFNRNLLARINRELDGNFDLDGFAHRAIWNGAHARMEMHLVSRRAQRIEVSAAGLQFEMTEGESIWTESSYKYEPADIVAMLEACGFRVGSQWVDPIDRFALTRAEAV